jgi:hypothetical protein
MGCMVPQSFSTTGNRSYLDLWAVTSDPWYPEYKTPIVAPEPSVERVPGAAHSTGGRIGTQMLLLVPPQDSVVRPWG